MKKATLLLAAGFIALQIFAQSSAEPFKKANTIILKTTKTDSENYLQFQRELMKFDYSVKKSNKELLTVSTDFHELKTHPGWNYLYIYRIIFMKGKIIIKPFWKSSMLFGNASDVIRWHYATSRTNVLNIIWRETLEMLKDYGGEITYKKM